MESPTSSGSVTDFTTLDLDAARVLVWSKEMNEWVSVPLRAFYELIGSGV